MLMHQLLDAIGQPDVVRALWNHQFRHSCTTKSIHSDSGAQLRNLGDMGAITEKGEPMRFLILLKMQLVSPSGGQKSNPAEPSICRIKGLWKSLYRDIKAIKGLTLFQLDFLINCSCSDLNTIPLNPTVSPLAPVDFQLGYKQIPLSITMGGNAASKAMDKVRKGYEELCSRYRKSHILCPYLFTRRGSGRLQRKVTIGDLVFIHKVNRIGKVKGKSVL